MQFSKVLTPKRMSAMVDYHKAFDKKVYSFYHKRLNSFRVSTKPNPKNGELIISSYDRLGGMQLEMQ
jgi:hypothetical protein